MMHYLFEYFALRFNEPILSRLSRKMSVSSVDSLMLSGDEEDTTPMLTTIIRQLWELKLCNLSSSQYLHFFITFFCERN